MDDLRRRIGEVRVRQVYADHGMSNVLQPLGVEIVRLQPPAAVAAAAVAALAPAKQGSMSVQNTTDSSGNRHLLVQLQVGQAGEVPLAAANSTAAKEAAGDAPGVATYHVWPKHSIVMAEQQYQQLLQATAADARLYRTSRVLQALDAGWVSVLSEQRKVRKLLLQVEEEAKKACGFAGLNHMQQ